MSAVETDQEADWSVVMRCVIWASERVVLPDHRLSMQTSATHTACSYSPSSTDNTDTPTLTPHKCRQHKLPQFPATFAYKRCEQMEPKDHVIALRLYDGLLLQYESISYCLKSMNGRKMPLQRTLASLPIFKCTSCRQQWHTGSKTLLQWNPLILNWECRLMQVNLIMAIKWLL